MVLFYKFCCKIYILNVLGFENSPINCNPSMNYAVVEIIFSVTINIGAKSLSKSEISLLLYPINKLISFTTNNNF